MSKGFVFSTHDKAPQHRADAWNAVIAESYFPLDLSFDAPQHFNGRLERATLGHVGFSRLIKARFDIIPSEFQRNAAMQHAEKRLL